MQKKLLKRIDSFRREMNYLILIFVYILLLISPGKSINEMKGRVMVLYIENLTKPLFWVVL